MPPKGNLFRNLQQLEQVSSAERQAAQLKRLSQSSGEILQTFLAYLLADAAQKMALGIAIGDPLLLRHEPTNERDPNAVQVFWQQGYPHTGVRELCSAMGIQSGSFYATFANKASLFDRAVDRYVADLKVPAPSPAAPPRPAPAAPQPRHAHAGGASSRGGGPRRHTRGAMRAMPSPRAARSEPMTRCSPAGGDASLSPCGWC